MNSCQIIDHKPKTVLKSGSDTMADMRRWVGPRQGSRSETDASLLAPIDMLKTPRHIKASNPSPMYPSPNIICHKIFVLKATPVTDPLDFSIKDHVTHVEICPVGLCRPGYYTSEDDNDLDFTIATISFPSLLSTSINLVCMVENCKYMC